MENLTELCLKNCVKNAIFPDENTVVSEALSTYRRSYNERLILDSWGEIFQMLKKIKRMKQISDQYCTYEYRIYPSERREDGKYCYVLPVTMIDILFHVDTQNNLLELWHCDRLVRKMVFWDEVIITASLEYKMIKLYSKTSYLDICCGFCTLEYRNKIMQEYFNKYTRNYQYSNQTIYYVKSIYLETMFRTLKCSIDQYSDRPNYLDGYREDIAAQIIYGEWFKRWELDRKSKTKK